MIPYAIIIFCIAIAVCLIVDHKIRDIKIDFFIYFCAFICLAIFDVLVTNSAPEIPTTSVFNHVNQELIKNNLHKYPDLNAEYQRVISELTEAENAQSQKVNANRPEWSDLEGQLEYVKELFTSDETGAYVAAQFQRNAFYRKFIERMAADAKNHPLHKIIKTIRPAIVALLCMTVIAAILMFLSKAKGGVSKTLQNFPQFLDLDFLDFLSSSHCEL